MSENEITEIERKPKNINIWNLMYPFTQGALGSYMGLMVPTLISKKAYLHARVLQWITNTYLLWLVGGLTIISVVCVELTLVRLMVTSLKKVGSSVMIITSYVSNFFFTNLIDYLTKGTIPNKYQLIG